MKKSFAFSLAEMMVVMLILTVVLAASAPIITKRSAQPVTTSAGVGSSVPVGTVIMWMTKTLPQGDDKDKWLECNGANFSAATYPDLKGILNSTTLPDFTGRVAQGSATPNTHINAGLPNITGTIGTSQEYCMADVLKYTSGAFYFTYQAGGSAGGGSDTKGWFTLDASRSSSIYGNSTTVQPPATTVKYLIKAKL